MGSRKGEKTALQREMAAAGEFGRKLPARVERKPPVICTPELASEIVERFAAGETVIAICASDDRFPSDRSFRTFVSRDEALVAKWENAKRLHAEVLMEQTGEIADREVIGPDGRHDSGAVQRDRLRIEQRHMRAAALDPARWGRQSTQVIKGDADNPLVVKEEIMMEKRIELFLAFQARTERPREPSGFGRPEPKAIEHQPPKMAAEEWHAYVKRIGSGG